MLLEHLPLNGAMVPEHQARTLFKSNLLRVVDYRCRGSRTGKQPEEWSPQPEIVIPRSGVFVRHDPDGTVVVDSNQILFFNGGQPYQVSHPVVGGDHSTIFVVQPAVLLDLLRPVDPSVEGRPERPFTKSHATLESRLRLLQYWLLQTSNPAAAEPFEVEEKVLTLLGAVVSLTAGHGFERQALPATGAAREHAELVEGVILVLGDRFRERLQLETLARAVYSSPYHLCRIFKKKTGLTIHQYLQRLRLAASLEQLAERPHDPLARIALDLGFSSHNHFTVVFRDKFGLAPSEFRRQVRVRSLREMSKILEA
jgi:AraC-like DNA-binding protein